MKKLIIFAIILIFLISCTKIEISENKEVIKNESKTNKTIIEGIEERVGEKLPELSTGTNYDTPSVVEKNALKETEAEDFGDVI